MTAPAKRHLICLDWDGTCVENAWPDMGEFMPGFLESAKRLHKAGANMFVQSARLNPLDPWTGEERDPAHYMADIAVMREMLDSNGLSYIPIYTKPGKPGADFYIDDKAERYTGRPGSWRRLTDKILLRMGETEPFYLDGMYSD